MNLLFYIIHDRKIKSIESATIKPYLLFIFTTTTTVMVINYVVIDVYSQYNIVFKKKKKSFFQDLKTVAKKQVQLLETDIRTQLQSK